MERMLVQKYHQLLLVLPKTDIVVILVWGPFSYAIL